MDLSLDAPQCPYCADHPWLGAIPHYPISRITLIEGLLIAVSRSHRASVVAWAIGRAMRRGDYMLAVHDGCVVSGIGNVTRTQKEAPDTWKIAMIGAVLLFILPFVIYGYAKWAQISIVSARIEIEKNVMRQDVRDAEKRLEELKAMINHHITCTSRHTPQSNWQEALKDAEPGDTLCLEPGAYVVSKDITIPDGKEDAPVTITGTDRDGVMMVFNGAIINLFRHARIRNMSVGYASCSKKSMFRIHSTAQNIEFSQMDIDTSDCSEATFPIRDGMTLHSNTFYHNTAYIESSADSTETMRLRRIWEKMRERQYDTR